MSEELDMVWDEIERLKAKNKKLDRALRIAAGHIGKLMDKNPQGAYEWLLLKAEEIAKEE